MITAGGVGVPAHAGPSDRELSAPPRFGRWVRSMGPPRENALGTPGAGERP
jgi:hypothetical protein